MGGSRGERGGGPDSTSADSRWPPAILFQGGVGIAVWMTVGLILDGLLAFRAPGYLDDPVRRELFRLAHAHGTLLSLLLVVVGLCGRRGVVEPFRAARAALRVGSLLMPLGFLLGGIRHFEGDPGLLVWMAPPAALLLIFGVVSTAISARRPGGG